MLRGSDPEIIGGIGFGRDAWPSGYHYHTDFSLLGNGSTTGNRDPYLPIEQEPMGNDYSRYQVESSLPSNKVYPYRSAPVEEEKYTFANSKTLDDVLNTRKERLQDPGATRPDPGAPKKTSQANVNHGEKWDPLSLQIEIGGSVLFVFMFMLFILMIVLAYLQNMQIQQLYKVIKKIVKQQGIGTGST